MAESPILIASDLSARNDRAVDRAIMLGSQLALPVHLVHVRKPGSKDDSETEKLRQVALGSLPDSAASIDIHLPIGSAPQEVAKTAADCNAALIVCAVARFNGLNDYFIGTAVDHILTEGKLPVLVVKQRPHADYRRLLVAVDFSPHSSHALRVAADMFPEAEITLMHAYHVAYEGFQKAPHLRDETLQLREKDMETFLADPSLVDLKSRVQPKFVYGDVGAALLQAVEELKPDLVVAGTHGAGKIRRAVLGSIASSMLAWIPQDMLVVPPGN